MSKFKEIMSMVFSLGWEVYTQIVVLFSPFWYFIPIGMAYYIVERAMAYGIGEKEVYALKPVYVVYVYVVYVYADTVIDWVKFIVVIWTVCTMSVDKHTTLAEIWLV